MIFPSMYEAILSGIRKVFSGIGNSMTDANANNFFFKGKPVNCELFAFSSQDDGGIILMKDSESGTIK